jgi:hypothetical protein
MPADSRSTRTASPKVSTTPSTKTDPFCHGMGAVGVAEATLNGLRTTAIDEDTALRFTSASPPVRFRADHRTGLAMIVPSGAEPSQRCVGRCGRYGHGRLESLGVAYLFRLVRVDRQSGRGPRPPMPRVVRLRALVFPPNERGAFVPVRYLGIGRRCSSSGVLQPGPDFVVPDHWMWKVDRDGPGVECAAAGRRDRVAAQQPDARRTRLV